MGGKKRPFLANRRPPEGFKVAEHTQPSKPLTVDPARRSPFPDSGPGSKSQSSHSSRCDLTELEQECDAEVLMKKTLDLETLKKVIEEYESLMSVRQQVAQKNLNPDYDVFEKLRSSRKLDANLKKCTNFVKKLKNFSTGQFDQIEKEFEGLNLTQYLSEIATALTEARFKIGDIQNAVNLFSMFHQRYREFQLLILDIYRKNLLPRKSDLNPSRVSKLSIDIRLFGELVMCGLFEKEEGFNLILNAVRNVVTSDKEGMQHISLVITFCRGLGYEMAELIPTNIRELCEKHNMNLPEDNWISSQKKQQMKQVLLNYYDNCCAEVVKCHENVLDSEMKNRRLLKTKGEIPDDRRTAHSAFVATFEMNMSIVKKFAAFIDKELPALRELPVDPEADEADSMLRVLNAEHGETVLPAGLQVFEDEETRAFYQDLPDMKVYLPQIAYRDNILKAAEQTAEIERREKEIAEIDEELEVALLNEKMEEEELGDGDADADDVLPSSAQTDEDKTEVIKPSFQAFLDGLLKCVNSSMIDQAARDFVDNFNTKSNRKKLVNYLFHIPWQRVDLIPLWARLVAVLSPVMPEVQLELCQMLFKDFRYLVRKKDQLFIETKLKIVRFIAELVNFGKFPKSDAFQCFKILLMNFTHHQIEMACAFLETCGRYLHRNADSHRRMQIYLEEFMRRKTLKSLESRYVNMVDHAYSIVHPKEESRKKKPPIMLAFIKHTIYGTLQRSNLEECIKVIRSLDWEDDQVVNYFIEVMSRPWNLKFQQFSVASSLLAALMPYRSHVAVRIVDNILEGTYQLIDSVHPRYNSQRVALAIFVGEFYNYRLVGSSEIFTILYALISHHVVLDHSYLNPFDPPDYVFRIRLVCTLLKTCGMYFNHGNSKKKLNCYLKYFLRYYWFKKISPAWNEYRRFPYVINDLVDETITMLRSNWKMPNDWEEACMDVIEMEDELRKTYFGDEMQVTTDYSGVQPSQLPQIPENEIYERESPANAVAWSQQEFYVRETPPLPVDMAADMPVGESKTEGTDQVTTEDNWEQFKPTSAELAEFDAMMERLAIEPGAGRQAKADIPVPIKTSPLKGDNKSVPVEAGTVKVALLTRKGNKQQIKHIAISEDTEFVKRITESQQAEELERKRIKQLTLGINRRQQEEEEYEVQQQRLAQLKATTMYFK